VRAHQPLSGGRILLALAGQELVKPIWPRDQNTSCSATSPSIASFIVSGKAS
jgi:hypothetical protein